VCANGTTALCSSTLRSCDDNITCTLDSCDPAVGCIFRAQNASCSNDVCQVGICDSTGGCSVSPLSCGQAPNCSTATCVAFAGCNIQAVSCNSTDSGGCNIDYCNNQTSLCDVQVIACGTVAGPDTPIILAATLTTAAVVGIVIAIVVILALVGGAAAYRYRSYQTDEDAPISNNPLYEGAGNKQDNPLFKPD